jgi:hypothetical protein
MGTTTITRIPPAERLPFGEPFSGWVRELNEAADRVHGLHVRDRLAVGI